MAGQSRLGGMNRPPPYGGVKPLPPIPHYRDFTFNIVVPSARGSSNGRTIPPGRDESAPPYGGVKALPPIPQYRDFTFNNVVPSARGSSNGRTIPPGREE